MRVKLIRDEIVIGQGGQVRCANSIEGKHLLLIAKLHEEAEEIARCATDPEEYADLLEVFIELARLNGVTWDSVHTAFQGKRKRLGGFRKGRTWIKDD